MPEIITARLRLRHFTVADIDVYHAVIHNDPEVMRYMVGGQPRPRERTAAMIARVGGWWLTHRYGVWAVEQRADGALLGHCGLTQDPDTGEIELAYALARHAWGQGLATEAARACLRYGFETLGMGRVIALAEPENVASRRVMEKAGMHYEGITTTYYGGAELALCVATLGGFAPADEPYQLIDDQRCTKRARSA